jgi:signal transduction histidine kinase
MSKDMIDKTTKQARSSRKVRGENGCPSLRIAQLQDLSRALAHLAHDVQNYLAIINESAGWMKDLLKLKSKQRFGWIGRFFKRGQRQHSDFEPFFSGLNTIEKQVDQASTLTQRLSSFAHCLEKTRSIVNGNKVLEEIRDVLLRLTRDKGVRLELKLAEESSMIETDPSVFQLAVFDNAEQVIEGLKSGDCLTLESEVRDGQFQVHLTSPYHEGCNSSLIEKPDGQDFYWHMVEDLGGQIQRQSLDEKCVTTLVFTLTSGKERNY